MKNPISRFLSELVLWNISNVLCIALPTFAAYHVMAMSWAEFGVMLSSWQLSVVPAVVVVLTLTWGSWAALVWTRHRVIRLGMRVTTMFPGMLMIAGGALGLWSGFFAWFFWAGLIAAGIATIFLATAMARYFRPTNRVPQLSSYVLGFTLYPVAATALSMLVGAAWLHFFREAVANDWRDLFSIGMLYVSVIASALVTTLIPALLSSALRRFSCDVLPR